MKTTNGMSQYCKQVADKNQWLLNRDPQTFNDLIDGLTQNKVELGYQSCPCRLACGNRDLDRDLICPCDYATPDILEYGACYCNLFMRSDFYETIEDDMVIVPERRNLEKEQAARNYIKDG